MRTRSEATPARVLSGGSFDKFQCKALTNWPRNRGGHGLGGSHRVPSSGRRAHHRQAPAAPRPRPRPRPPTEPEPTEPEPTTRSDPGAPPSPSTGGAAIAFLARFPRLRRPPAETSRPLGRSGAAAGFPATFPLPQSLHTRSAHPANHRPQSRRRPRDFRKPTGTGSRRGGRGGA
ncbi:early nodulin-20-like [Onychomys torridus]|uniref:early nodulin-20-like n=1 Tax=Onychomys torridus TaxID=38674 RepID=UPI00167F43C6|nr:early nodulin-20-like [Onychomys torridus]